jgi:hypothetical protein
VVTTGSQVLYVVLLFCSRLASCDEVVVIGDTRQPHLCKHSLILIMEVDTEMSSLFTNGQNYLDAVY